MQWFDVDKAGLAKILTRYGIARVILELVQNGLDEPGVSYVHVRLDPEPGKPYVTITVTDDAPEGFKRLSDAWTLFAESWKKGDPTRRGRFNLGEKLVLALATEAVICTTTGSVAFGKNGRQRTRAKRERGSVVQVKVRMTRSEVAETVAALGRLIVPEGIEVCVGMGCAPDPMETAMTRPEPTATYPVTLPTEVADEEGNLRPTTRKTAIEVYEPLDHTGAWLYEMGIPVVQLDTPWSVNVLQRVPLNLDRDNVSPAYQRKVHAALLNAMAERVRQDPEAADEPWVREAAGAPECEPEAFVAVLDARFGEDRVMRDPSDEEAGHNAVAHGARLVHGNQLNAGERANLKRLRAEGTDPLKPAGKSPWRSPRPYSDDPDAEPVDVVPEEKWTDRMRQVVEYAQALHKLLIGQAVTVTVVRTTNSFAACYGSRGLDLNLRRLGHRWFNDTSAAGFERVTDLLIHEFAHHFESNHLSARYADACTKLGAKATRLGVQGRLMPGAFGYQL